MSLSTSQRFSSSLLVLIHLEQIVTTKLTKLLGLVILGGGAKNLDGWTINDEVRQNAPFELSGVLTTIGHYKYFITTLWYRRRCRTHLEQLMYLMVGNELDSIQDVIEHDIEYNETFLE